MEDLYLEYEYLLASLAVVLSMLGMGAILPPSDFVAIARFPRALFVGLAVQILAIPALAWALAECLGLAAGPAMGLLLVAVVPGGSLSNLLTHLARAHVALSIALTALATIASLATAPALLSLLLPVDLPDVPALPAGRMAFELGVCSLAPLAVGMGLGAAWSSQRQRLSRWLVRASLLASTALWVGAGSSGRLVEVELGATALSAVPIFAALCFGIAVAACRGAGLRGQDALTVGFEACYRNVSLSFFLKASLFPTTAGVADPLADGAFLAILLYGPAASAVVLGPLLWHRWRRV